MKVIIDRELYSELIKEQSEQSTWNALFNEYSDLKNCEIPILSGGLDHIEKNEYGVYFRDIGCNRRDNSFVIRPSI